MFDPCYTSIYVIIEDPNYELFDGRFNQET
jgi:hypothetical protein